MANISSTSTQTEIVDQKKGVKFLVDKAPELKVLPSEYVLPLERNPLSAIDVEIPVIDLSGLDGTVEDRKFTIHALSSACAHWGFFSISNHGIKMSLTEEMLEVAQGFFDLTLEEKMKYASDNVMDPIRYGTSLNTSKKHALHWRDFFRHCGHPFNSLHLWPENPPKYKRVAKEYLEQIWLLAMKIAGAISESLGLDRHYIEKSIGEGCQILANNYYPRCPEPSKTLGLAAHSDHGALTILMQNNVNGLQVKHDNTWFAVRHVPGTFVVNLGDYLEILSNGRYKSLEHRAVVNSQTTRISVAVGHGPHLSSTIAPASQLVSEMGIAEFQPIVYQEYMKLQQTTTIRGKTALDAIRMKNIQNR